MASATTTNSAARKGQVMLELPLLLVTAGLGLSVLSLLFVFCLLKAWMMMEVYTLARAHLYHNDLGRCAISSYWPHNALIEQDFLCDFKGSVTAQTRLKNNGLGQSMQLSTRFALNPEH